MKLRICLNLAASSGLGSHGSRMVCQASRSTPVAVSAHATVTIPVVLLAGGLLMGGQGTNVDSAVIEAALAPCAFSLARVLPFVGLVKVLGSSSTSVR